MISVVQAWFRESDGDQCAAVGPAQLLPAIAESDLYMTRQVGISPQRSCQSGGVSRQVQKASQVFPTFELGELHDLAWVHGGAAVAAELMQTAQQGPLSHDHAVHLQVHAPLQVLA